MTARRRVLLDENIPTDLRRRLPGVEAISAEFLGLKGVRNGDLIRRARADGFDVLVTADRPLAFGPRSWSPMACVFLTTNDSARIRPAAERIDTACRTVASGDVVIVEV